MSGGSRRRRGFAGRRRRVVSVRRMRAVIKRKRGVVRRRRGVAGRRRRWRGVVRRRTRVALGRLLGVGGKAVEALGIGLGGRVVGFGSGPSGAIAVSARRCPRGLPRRHRRNGLRCWTSRCRRCYRRRRQDFPRTTWPSHSRLRAAFPMQGRAARSGSRPRRRRRPPPRLDSLDRCSVMMGGVVAPRRLIGVDGAVRVRLSVRPSCGRLF